jgi:site-specific recombinase XerD
MPNLAEPIRFSETLRASPAAFVRAVREQGLEGVIAVQKYGCATGINIEVYGLCAHSLRATASTNALENGADIAKVQDWLGHANV